MADTAVYQWRTKTPSVDPMKPTTLGAKDPSTPAPLQSPSAGTAQTPSFNDLMKGGTGNASSGPSPSFNDLFAGVGEARAQNVQAAQQNISQGFQPAQPSLAGEQARNSFLKSQDETQRQVLEQSALAGRGETGQIVGDNRNFLTQQAAPQRANFEAQLQAQEEQQAQARQQNAMGNLLAMEGLGEQSRQTQAANALTARGQDITMRGQDIQAQQASASLAESARQFNSQQDFQKWATEQGWTQDAIQRAWQSAENTKAQASTEKIAFADLNFREQQLAQDVSQFKDKLAFDKYATEGGWSQQEADRVWQATQNEKQQTFQAGQNALDRELTKYVSDSKLNLDAQQLAESVRQFDSKLAFDQWATQGGFDQQEQDRIWQAHLQDLNQKWQTGERLGAEENQVLIENNRIQAQQQAQEFDKLTQLEVLGKTQEWDKAKLELTNTYQTLRDQNQMSHDQAMAVIQGDIQTKLTQMGIDADKAKQAAQIEADKWNTERQMAQQSAIANAELLYKYDSLRTQAGLDKEKLNQNAEQIANQAAQFMMSYGLDEKRTEAAITSQESKDKLGEMSILMEMAGDNPDMVHLVSQQFVGYLKDSGAISQDQADAMVQNINNPPSAPTDAWKTDNAVNRIGTGLDQLMSGDFLTGAKNTVGGQVDVVTGVGKDIGHAAASAGRWIGSLF